jgi:hypothetical protein
MYSVKGQLLELTGENILFWVIISSSWVDVLKIEKTFIEEELQQSVGFSCLIASCRLYSSVDRAPDERFRWSWA